MLGARIHHAADLGCRFVITETGARQSTWVIVSRRVIDKDAPALFRTREATLTLTTCWPIRYFGSAPDRLILTAKPATPGKASTRTNADKTKR